MGRELKRVPLDFDWPIKKVWGGYVNPFGAQACECPACGGTGYAPQARVFSAQWYGYVPFDAAGYGAVPLTTDHPALRSVAERHAGDRDPGRRRPALEQEIMRLFSHFSGKWCYHLIQADVDALVAAERLWDFTRTPRTDEQRATVNARLAEGHNSWLPESNGYAPTAAEVNDWAMRSMGHDAINHCVCIRARCAREGVPVGCARCGGGGSIWPPGVEALYDAWENEEPPTGDGYQLWSTTSEGHPDSPVFPTLDALCEYAAEHCTTFGAATASATEWRSMLDEGFVRHEEGNMIFM